MKHSFSAVPEYRAGWLLDGACVSGVVVSFQTRFDSSDGARCESDSARSLGKVDASYGGPQ
jgi:hypothetical protein